jgi:hypothetical protein
MKRYFLVASLLLALAPAAPAQVVDRMVAVVNKQVLLQSQLEQALRVQFLMAGKPLSTLTSTDAGAALDRLVDQTLLDQQIADANMVDPTSEEMVGQVKELRAHTAGAETEEGWQRLLSGYGLSQQELETQLAMQFRILKFVDLRFRGMVRVDKSAIETYYREKFLPEIQRQGGQAPELREVSTKIERILTEQQMDELMSNWLQALHAQSRIEKMLAPGAKLELGPVR